MTSDGGNPFRIHGVVEGEYFTDRAEEIVRVLRCFREPGSKLLVYGPRRMGKTSALTQGIARHEAEGGVGFLADLSTATTLVDVANRLLEAAGVALGRRWKDAIHDFVARLGLSLTLRPDPATGTVVPSLDLRLRGEAIEQQRTSFAQALDALDALAGGRGATLGVVLDEFQEIRRFGGDTAEWHLRGILQHHRHVSYVLAGSQQHIIERMVDQGAAFYGLADHLAFGPIDPAHLSRWIDDRLGRAGVKADGVGSRIVEALGPRTRDIVQVARQLHANCAATGRATTEEVTRALDDVVAEQQALLESLWRDLTALQQNVLRAVAADLDGLTTAASLRRFGLASSGSTANAAGALVGAGRLLRAPTRTGYAFDSPFLRRWVELTTLSDVGAGPRDPPS